jgi:hypothetical protein
MVRWTFTPFDLEKWNQSEERILFVAAEPNGGQPNGGNYDMNGLEPQNQKTCSTIIGVFISDANPF